MSNSTERVRVHRRSRRRGLRCVTVRLHETDIDTLVATDYLAAEARQDAKAIKDAAQSFVWEKLYECAHG